MNTISRSGNTGSSKKKRLGLFAVVAGLAFCLIGFVMDYQQIIVYGRSLDMEQQAVNDAIDGGELSVETVMQYLRNRITDLQQQPPQYYHGEVPHTRESLRETFTKMIEEEVKFNNWRMGCTDLQFLAPYFRAILDRTAWSKGRQRRIILDVGANNGDDAQYTLNAFQNIQGMCHMFSSPISLISVEPSPKVFCELADTLKDKPKNNMQILNVALSNQTGHLSFSDPGNEGGKLIGSNFQALGSMTESEYASATTCRVSDYQNQTVDYKRVSSVPTYTLDLLMTSLQGLGKVQASDEIFVLKIDTEGHDANVLLGSKQMVEDKRITFVIFETYYNHLVRTIVNFMTLHDYQCFIMTPSMLLPVDGKDWWYHHMDNFTGSWWGNGVCGIKNSETLKMLWRMYHSDDLAIASSYELL